MSYEKQIWKTGDTITSVGLNHIEDGIANNSSSVYFVTMNQINENDEIKTQLDKTFAEIEQAALSKIIIIKRQQVLSDDESFILFTPLQGIGKYNEAYALLINGNEVFICTNKNDYPILDNSIQSPK